VHKSKLKRITLAICFAFLPFSAHSAGLGKLTVISGLGEPLRAEIDLVSTTPEELSTLTAAIAPQEAYAIQGIERRSVHNAIQVDVVKKPDGTGMLKLSTRQPVDDPFLDMLIQVDWATGRLLREYTVLLDPPGYQDVQPSIVARPTNPADIASPITSKPLAEPRSDYPPATYAEPEIVAEYKTKSGDNLSKIAKEMQLEGYNLDQMLVALYRANPAAFDGGNMNRLKVGQIIKAPTYEDLSTLTARDAAKEVRVQTSDWNAYRNKLAGVIAESAPMAEDAGDQATSGKLRAATEDQAAATDSGPKDVVKLSKSEPGSTVGANADAKALRDKLSALEEENIAREKNVAEANERVAMLEKQIADLQALLTIKDKTLSGLQDNATATNETMPTESEIAQTPLAESEPGDTPATAAETAPAVTDEPKPLPNKKPIAVQDATPEPNMLDGLMDNAVLLGLAGGALVFLGGGWILLRNRRKRNLDSFEHGILTAGGLKANTVFGNTSGGTVDTGDTSFLTDFSQSPSGMIDTHDVDPIAEAEVYMAYGRDSQAEEILNDAISKEPTRYELHLKLLEIFAGRNDTSAFEAVAGELYSTLGSSDSVWIKVAEMGHKLEPTNPLYDLSSSHSPTKTLPAAAAKTGASSAIDDTKLDAADFSDAEVMTASSLGFSLDSKPASASDQAKVEENSLDFDLGFNTVPPDVESSPSVDATPKEDVATEIVTKPQDNEMSFDIDFGQKLEPAAGLDASDSQSVGADEIAQFETPKFSKTLPSLELTDLNFVVETDQSTSANELAKEPVSEDSSGLDFNFDLSGVELPDSTTAKTDAENLSVSETTGAGSLEVDLSGISLDMDITDTSNGHQELAGTEEDELDEVNTKLDLVTAYMDMGDNEGARELLDEVLKEGGSKQRERAQRLLNSLS
jgi:pilus assembly protein FimV